MADEGANISTGINQGEAQVFTPYVSDYAVKSAQIKSAQQKEKQKAEAGIYSTLGKLKEIDIFEKHQPIFAEKQKELYDYTLQNIDKLRSGDAQTTIEWQGKVNKLYNDANLSAGIKKQYTQLGQDMIKNENKYRPDAFDYLENFNGYDPDNDLFFAVDPSKIKQNVNYQDRVVKELSTYAQKQAQTTGGEYFDTTKNVWVTSNKKTFTLQQAEDLIAQDLQDPVLFEQAAYDWNNAPDKASYTDPVDYYKKKYAPKLVVKDSTFSVTEPSQGTDIYSEGDIDTNQQQVNIETPKFENGQPVSGKFTQDTFTTQSKVTHKTPVKANISLNKEIIPLSGDLPTTTTGVVQVEMGETIVVPVYKKGTTQQGQGKTDIGGSIVSDRDLDNAKKKGAVEYKVYTTGTYTTGTGDTKEQNSVLIPVDQVQNALNKKNIPVQKLQDTANQLNGQQQTTGTPKKGDTKKLSSGKTAVFNGTKWVLQ